jgi:hypothetical protein
MLLVMLHHSRIHFGIYSSVPEDCYSCHFFLCPKIGYRMVVRLPYRPPSVGYGTILLPQHTLWREEGKNKKSSLGASSHTSVRWIIGIVDFDGQLPCQPSNKPRNHGGTVRRNSGMDVANQPTPSPGASSEGVGQGRSLRFCIIILTGQEKSY